ncbi:protein lifeguard 4-like [Ctenocephalides felis]|uniref:protein lifeguard 4-like n=1 Tax=Ctenocephalides felis TaxID=7515 RepID=UPI00003D4807|nr:protein lifeguard 4-like [Ctenocephalides felis]XP_026467425.1 protein lifeguard 4-like [Ctenocephalides felis]
MATVPLMFAEDDLEGGGKEGSIENDFAYNNNVINASVRVRLGFIRKVYGLLTVQLLLSLLVGIACQIEPVQGIVKANDWLVLVCMISSIGVLIALHIKRKETPTNFILLTIFTITNSISVGVLVTHFKASLVLQAIAITLCVVIGITLFTLQNKLDLSMLPAALFTGLCCLLVGGIIQIFTHSTIFELVLCSFGALIFSLFLLYDTHVMMTTLSPEEYILATINLYLDIVNLFIYILRILQAADRG